MHTITVRKQTNYGTEMVYPVDEAARAFARIAGTKTLSAYTIQQIKQLGYTLVLEQGATQL